MCFRRSGFDAGATYKVNGHASTGAQNESIQSAFAWPTLNLKAGSERYQLRRTRVFSLESIGALAMVVPDWAPCSHSSKSYVSKSSSFAVISLPDPTWKLCA